MRTLLWWDLLFRGAFVGGVGGNKPTFLKRQTDPYAYIRFYPQQHPTQSKCMNLNIFLCWGLWGHVGGTNPQHPVLLTFKRNCPFGNSPRLAHEPPARPHEPDSCRESQPGLLLGVWPCALAQQRMFDLANTVPDAAPQSKDRS